MDAIGILEAAYDVKGSTRAWLERLCALVAPELDRGFGIAAFAYDLENGLDPSTLVLRDMADGVVSAMFAMMKAHPAELRQIHGSLNLATATQRVGLTRKQAIRFLPHAQHLHVLGIRDVLSLTVVDPTGRGYAFGAPAPDLQRPAGPERAMWTRVGVHIAAAGRLRHAIASQRTPEPYDGADAVLSPSGKVLNAEREAQTPAARESLRDAVLAIDRARSQARADSGEALTLWQGLIAGQWSLIEHFDSDGRRYIVARRNDPSVTDPRALSLRERQVLAYAALGQSLKIIAYSLGLSLATVAGHRARAMRKLGLRSQAELVALFAGLSSIAPATESVTNSRRS
jgi:DNA-binding CsgD family transcriptional regulator